MPGQDNMFSDELHGLSMVSTYSQGEQAASAKLPLSDMERRMRRIEMGKTHVDCA